MNKKNRNQLIIEYCIIYGFVVAFSVLFIMLDPNKHFYDFIIKFIMLLILYSVSLGIFTFMKYKNKWYNIKLKIKKSEIIVHIFLGLIFYFVVTLVKLEYPYHMLLIIISALAFVDFIKKYNVGKANNFQ